MKQDFAIKSEHGTLLVAFTEECKKNGMDSQ